MKLKRLMVSPLEGSRGNGDVSEELTMFSRVYSLEWAETIHTKILGTSNKISQAGRRITHIMVKITGYQTIQSMTTPV